MAILNIALMGNEGLKRVADPIDDPQAPEIAKLADDMRDTLENIASTGIAAPQVFVSKRIFVYRLPEHLIPSGSKMKPIPWRVLINPVLKPLSDEKRPVGFEKCLSIPGLHGEVPRFTRVSVTAQQLDGSSIEITASGYHARLLQHEYDHLDGILYPQRMTNISDLAYNSELGDRFYIPRYPALFVE
ncbi:MAG: peptide deformylase [Rhodospirillales bacterium]|jgi:peptide deformylase|nr:peptide deformylase [Rhodospirillales bacterium]MDP7651249.1 peptide deformylase [Rhodospirillales bacterium]